MADYFFLLDRVTFASVIRPALTKSWQQRSFEPCRSMCEQLLPAARAYGERYHTGDDQPLLELALSGLTFDRHTWRALVSETLLFGAVEIPEFQVCAETLCCLLAPQQYRAPAFRSRSSLSARPFSKGTFRFTRDLTFGAAIYRPEFAGYNSAADVRCLADYLSSVRPEAVDRR